MIILFFLVILVPQVCAQTKKITPEEAAAMRTTFVEYSKRYIGKAYVRGATGPEAFDCSGLVFACSRESIGVQLPRQTTAIYAFCTLIDDAEREVGDLVFFTTNGEINHVGIYAGNGQFINAASDGPNTGVILSSLKENYWKGHYYRTGRFLPASGLDAISDTKKNASDANDKTDKTTKANAETSTESSKTASAPANSASGGNGSFLSNIVLDATLNFDWNFYTASSFRLNPRGFSTMLHAMYEGKTICPGVGTMFRYDAGTGTVQLPLVVSLTIGNYFRLFFGPVIGLGSPTLPGDEDTDIKHSFFPGIMGVCWQTPSFAAGKTRISFQQDIHYTIFNDTDKSALSLKNSIVSGLVFSSGVRVTLPLSKML